MMCERCKPIPGRKIFWLSQIHEMLWQAEQIVKKGASPHTEIQSAIDYYNESKEISKDDLKEIIFEIIKDYTIPRETDKKQLELF